jgi:hypothetical protein
MIGQTFFDPLGPRICWTFQGTALRGVGAQAARVALTDPPTVCSVATMTKLNAYES